MTFKETIKAALDLLHELDADPRHPVIRHLSHYVELMREGTEESDDVEIHLIATIEQGGKYAVTDQSGRPVRGVKSVAVFRDPQTGEDVMQVNL